MGRRNMRDVERMKEARVKAQEKARIQEEKVLIKTQEAARVEANKETHMQPQGKASLTADERISSTAERPGICAGVLCASSGRTETRNTCVGVLCGMLQSK